MNAFTELAIFCGEHPEIRAHKRIGELLQATAAELAQLQKRLDVACHVKSKDKVGFDWEILDTIAQLRDELDKCVAWNEDEDSPHAQFEQTIAQLRAELDEARKVIIELTHPLDYDQQFSHAHAWLSAHPEETK